VTDKALEEVLFRAAHGRRVRASRRTRPSSGSRLLPSVVRVLLATFLFLGGGPLGGGGAR